MWLHNLKHVIDIGSIDSILLTLLHSIYLLASLSSSDHEQRFCSKDE